ncbi:conserved hypothetical protein [Aspergillus lentulus]|uniref:DRBM domain-containing protein n=1 Tax=Aspergillus lentulus TaxID=293939 RepID=A0ABQ0ZYK1_ASPLE|nr:conserved hypothetical protein [Aspergillus lentulus]GFF36086.1 conserved hypothetical protein [Aspergillus lentulus]GFF64939.1 conserved hypothetical protein [Aspergillus lentulus]GFF69268.1 conserved hypothetical protein [Aspergillus lentulus]GFF88821.1 conserved hypothetical protein [Aspergillus lentulus]GFG05029.1 conserved hypothetical protein [Aspergillus lentulus]
MASTQGNVGRKAEWIEKLEKHCKTAGLGDPVYTLFSDRRGGRTAWSSSVKVQGRAYAARYWYDGNFTINAKHDAAEVALTLLTYQQQPQARSETLPGKVWP